MKPILHIFYLVAALWCISFTAGAAESLPVKSGRAKVQLVTSYDRAMPGRDIHVALSMTLEPHWHTYWRNAGGPGEGAQLYWELPETLSAGKIIWPLPKLVHTGPIVNFAFEDRLLLPMVLHISKDTKLGDVLTVQAEAAYLVCYQVCLPESAKLSLPLVIGEPIKDARWSANINRAIKNAPQTDASFKASGRLESSRFIIDIKADALKNGRYKNPYFFPYVQDLINADKPQNAQQAASGIRMSMTPGWILEEGLKGEQTGVIAYDQKTENGWTRRGVIVTAIPNSALDIGDISGPLSQSLPAPSIGFLAAIFSALLGGIILNLMPCVFPILSLKALGFAKAAHEDKAVIRRHGWYYTFGVMLSFLMLASILLILKSSGAAIGWGFQLQNPVLVATLALLFFTIALNLFGVFEIGMRLQNTGASLAQSGGSKGAFFTGVLAVIAATPCTAPFMAGALGYALAQPAALALIVFLALGAGFALPFLLLSYAPALLKRLPKPGAWMDLFKQFLAFPMLGASLWLLWVLAHLAGPDAAIRSLLAFLALALAIWLLKRKAVLAKTLAVLSLAIAVYLVVFIKPAPSASTQNTAEHGMWSAQRVQELRAQGQPVFVDFTARWCVTCKVNETLVLHKQATKDLFKRTNTAMLIADWTRKDAVIAKELARHGRSGVPLYLLYPPGTDEVMPKILPQTLTFKTLEKALNSAQGTD